MWQNDDMSVPLLWPWNHYIAIEASDLGSHFNCYFLVILLDRWYCKMFQQHLKTGLISILGQIGWSGLDNFKGVFSNRQSRQSASTRSVKMCPTPEIKSDVF